MSGGPGYCSFSVVERFKRMVSLREHVARAIGRQVTLGDVEPRGNWLLAADAALHAQNDTWPAPGKFPEGPHEL